MFLLSVKMSKMKDIAIFGVGGFGREVLTLIQDINKVEPTWNVIGFLMMATKSGMNLMV